MNALALEFCEAERGTLYALELACLFFIAASGVGERSNSSSSSSSLGTGVDVARCSARPYSVRLALKITDCIPWMDAHPGPGERLGLTGVSMVMST